MWGNVAKVLVLASSTVVQTGADNATSPVQKVVKLLQEMKAQVEKETAQDQEAHEKYACWCTTNKDAKTEAVAAAEERIAQLESFLEESAGVQAELKTDISSLEAGIADDQDALATAAGIRNKEMTEFQASEKDMKESLGYLREAIKVLSKVQLVQRKKAAQAETRPLLLQLRSALAGVTASQSVRNVKGRLDIFKNVMQRDLWDMMSSLDEVGGPFLKKRFAAIEERGQLSAGQSPGGLVGAAAGASSYNSRSGRIYGLLSEMRDEFERDLFADQKAELQALVAYQSLRAAKEAEISSAQAAAAKKRKMLAENQAKAEEAREDLAATRDALDADQQFLVGLEKNCKANEEDHAARAKVRAEEIRALGETIKILTADDARDYFGKTLAFVETASMRHRSVGAEANRAIDTAMQRILHVAKKHKNWILASLAVHVRLDAFTRVKEAMDKMTAELKAQQKAEAEKKDFCTQEIDSTEDEITAKTNDQEDLEGKKLGLENTIAALMTDLKELRTQVSEAKVSLKRAGEDRAAENKLFQQSISDQRATAQIIRKAKARLAKFYITPSLAQAKPGQAIAPPPPQGKDYEKSGGAAGVLQLLDMILTDAAQEEAELLSTEQNAQSLYATMVKDMNDAISADEAAIAEKTKLAAEAASRKAETKAALLETGEQLAELNKALSAVHVDCDFLLKYFDVRQQARQEELDAIADAKAVLSGADFGKAAVAEV